MLDVLLLFDASGVSLYHNMMVINSMEVVHQLRVCSQSESLGEKGYPFINSEVYCELNVFVLFVYAGAFVHKSICTRGREGIMYQAYIYY